MSSMSRESHDLFEFMESDEKLLIFHFDTSNEAYANYKKLHKFKDRHSLDIMLIRRGAAIYAIKEDKEWLIR